MNCYECKETADSDPESSDLSFGAMSEDDDFEIVFECASGSCSPAPVNKSDLSSTKEESDYDDSDTSDFEEDTSSDSDSYFDTVDGNRKQEDKEHDCNAETNFTSVSHIHVQSQTTCTRILTTITHLAEEDCQTSIRKVKATKEQLSVEFNTACMEGAGMNLYSLNPSHSIAKKANAKKQVHFDESNLVQLYEFIDDEESQDTRRCYWEVFARDRAHFKSRIERHAKTLCVILNSQHRDIIYHERFHEYMYQ